MADKDKSDQWNLDDFGVAMAQDDQGIEAQPEASTNQASMMFRGQFVKKIHYDGPGLAQKVEGQPKTTLNYTIDLKEVEPKLHEVLLSVTAEVSDDKIKLITINVSYGVLYQLDNIPAEHQERLLISEGGRFMFPYLQRLVADIMREGGVPGFQLPQIDFYKAYQQMKEAK